MTPTIPHKITRKQASPILARTFPEYKGHKVKVVFTDKVTFDDLNWSGGTCCKFKAIQVDGSVTSLVAPAPWNNPYEGLTVDLPENVLIVEHSYFCGTDCGITIHAHPSYGPKLLEA